MTLRSKGVYTELVEFDSAHQTTSLMNFAADGWKPTPDQSLPGLNVNMATDFSYDYLAEQKGKPGSSECFPSDTRLDVLELVNYWVSYVTMPELEQMCAPPKFTTLRNYMT